MHGVAHHRLDAFAPFRQHLGRRRYPATLGAGTITRAQEAYLPFQLPRHSLRRFRDGSYDSLRGGYQSSGAVDLLCDRLGKESTGGEPILELVDDILYWCWQEAEQELRSSGRRRSGAPKLSAATDELAATALTERRSARKHLVNYRLVRDAIEMTASSASKSS